MSRWLIARREFSSLQREKTILLAIAIQLFIAGFSSFLLVGLVTFYDPSAASHGDVEIGVAGDTQDDLIEAATGEGPWRLVQFDEEARAIEQFETGHLDAVLITRKTTNRRVSVEAIVPGETIQSTIIVVHVRDVLRIYEQQERSLSHDHLTTPPLAVPNLPGSQPTFGFTYTILIPLLIFLPAFISGSIALDTFTEEIDKGTLELLRVSPLSSGEIVDGKFLPAISIVPLQVTAWLGLLWLNGSMISHPIILIVLATAIGTIVVCTGGALALLFRSRQSAQLVYSLGIIGLFLVASLLPEGPPNIIAKFAVASQTTSTYTVFSGYILLAVISYLLARRFVARQIDT